MLRSPVIQLLFVLCSAPSVYGAEPTNLRTDELIGCIDASVSLLSGLPSFDLIGQSDATNQFSDEIVQTESVNFRLQFDLQSEQLTWATKNLTQSIFPNGSLAAPSVAFYGVNVVGPRVTEITSKGVAKRSYKTFDDAIHASSIPLPQYWGVVQFPCFSDERAELGRLRSLLADDDSGTRVHTRDNGIEFTSRHDRTAQKFEIHTWVFSLPDYEVTKFSVDRSVTGKAINYLTQDVTWEAHFGRRVPFRISTENGVARPRVGKLIELGKRFVDTEVVWLKIGDIPTTRHAAELVGTLHVQKFIDEGQRLSKSRSDY